MVLFDLNGRCIPSRGMRLFSENRSFYYKIIQPKIIYEEILSNSIKNGILNDAVSVEEFKNTAEELLNSIKKDKNFSNILKGPHVPFINDLLFEDYDLGSNLEKELLPKLKEAFISKNPNSKFTAVLQGNTQLTNCIQIEKNSNYQKYLAVSKKKSTVGWYFPQSFQEYDVESQRKQFAEINKEEIMGANFCLSGALDTIAALIGSPNLLNNEENYSPLLCLSSYEHDDPRMVLLVKAYGPHLEFWCMSQMITKEIKQVSEQWTAGISIYK